MMEHRYHLVLRHPDGKEAIVPQNHDDLAVVSSFACNLARDISEEKQSVPVAGMYAVIIRGDDFELPIFVSPGVPLDGMTDL